MIDQKKLSLFWDEQVQGQFKHYLNTEFDKKLRKYKRDLKEKMLRYIDFSEIDTAIDWGCGGGVGALLLSDYCSVIILDISETSLEKCSQLLNKNNKKIKQKIKLDDLSSFEVNENIDLIFCTSVIQHFPLLEYWNRVVEIWKKINPKWIAIQIRHGDQNKWSEEEYFNETKNYILGLILTTDEVINKFDSYELVHNELIDDNYSMYEYFVFRRPE